MKRQIPVYLFVGFLEGGKTHMIQESMEDERFNSGEKTMIICCEEGIDEYDTSRFWGKNVYFENVENEEDITLAKLEEISNKHIIDRIIVEYNGMWQLENLFMNMPENWDVYQCVMAADSRPLSFTMQICAHLCSISFRLAKWLCSTVQLMMQIERIFIK